MTNLTCLKTGTVFQYCQTYEENGHVHCTIKKPSKPTKKARKRVYVAGRYSADNVVDVLNNIGYGIHETRLVAGAGFAPFCPWLDCLYNIASPGGLEKEDFYAMSEAWLEVSDALYLLEGWATSKGTLREIERARELTIPVFTDLGELINWGARQ